VVQTVDFFTPILDDPYAFGAVAAANALSDIYAMGGRPLFALNIVAFPVKRLPTTILAEIVRGGAEKAAEGGVTIIGGHSIEDPEPKFGMAVTGVIDPARIVTKGGARPGDVLFLTKPLGTGIMTTALKRGALGADALRAVTASMTALNRGASEAMMRIGPDAATDVTGYGLAGHLIEILEASGVGATVWWSRLPLLEGARELAILGHVPGGTRRTLDERAASLRFAADLDEIDRLMVADAQTSGGLLIAVAPEKRDALERELRGAGAPAVREIGVITAGPAGVLAIER